MGVEQPPNDAAAPKRRWCDRGESIAVRIGIAVFAILLIAMGTSGWWLYQTKQRSQARATVEQVEVIGAVLSQSAEVMLETEQISSLRRLITEVARNYGLTECRICLPGGQILADADPTRITLSNLPERWIHATVPAPVQPHDDYTILRTYALKIPQRGWAQLEIVAMIKPHSTSVIEAEGGVGLIGAATLISILLVYRRIRARVRVMGTIRDALMESAEGEADPKVLAVGENLGVEAGAWNMLMNRLDNVSREEKFERVIEAVTTDRTGHGELNDACNVLPQGLVLVDNELKVSYANGAATKLLHVDRDELVGAEISQFIEEQDVLEAVRTAATGKAPRRVTLETGELQGKGVLRFSVSPIRSRDEQTGMVVIEDITQQRVAEEARNAFLANATHELRTPLTNIRLYVETALEEGEEKPVVRAEALNVINQESRRLERVVGDMLSVAEIEAGSFKIRKDDIRIDELLREIETDYKAQAKDKEIALTFDLAPKFPVLQGDRDKVTLAIYNLIGNALKYTPRGGHVSVTAEHTDDVVRVEVTDSGIGISEEDAERIFDKFYRAKDTRVAKITGSGLGLALAREVIHLHGGNITVESQLDKGSTFVLTIPSPSEDPK